MADSTITTAFVQQYFNNLLHLAQQMKSRLRDTVRVESGVTGKTAFFDRLGATSMVQVENRHGDSPLIEPAHSRRRVALTDWDWGALVDNPDKLRMLISPESEYAINGAAAMNRGVDSLILAAARGTAYSGEDGGTAVALPSTQKVTGSTSGLTLAKLLSAKELLDAAEVDPDEPRYLIHSARQATNLLNTTEVKSADYNTVKALVAGQINTFLGFNFIRSQLLTLSSTIRYCLAFSKSGIGLAIGQDIKKEIAPRPDKRFNPYIYFAMTMGATRIEDAKVVEIACLES